MPSDWTALYPHLALAASGLAVFAAATLRRDPPKGLLLALALAGAVCAGLTALDPGQASPTPMIVAGGLSRFFTGLIAAVTVLTLLLVHPYARERGFSGDVLYGLVCWAALGMVLTATAANWVILLVGVELLSLCLYALIALRREDPLAAEAALKYFLPGAVALAILLFGIALVYAGTGRLDMAASLSASSATAKAGLILALVGIAFKLSLAPVHVWTPDVYQGAPAPVAAFLSTGSKAAVAAALLRLAAQASPEQAQALEPALWGLAALSMAVGNVGALCQKSVKRILAYSSIAQMGYVAMAALAARTGGTQAAMFYLGAYVVMELGAFGAVGMLSTRQADLDSLEDYRGLGYSRPWRAGLLALCLLSLAGLPPTAGFVGKFVVFEAAVRAGYGYLAVIGILMAVVALFYYLRVAAVLYMRPAEAGQTALACGWAPAAVACAVIAVLVFWLGIVPGGFLELIARLVPA